MALKIVITGIGIITSIGRNAEETFNSLIKRKSGIRPVAVLETVHRDEFVVGEIPLTNDELIKLADSALNPPFTRTALLGIIAARQAFEDAGLDMDDGIKTGLVSATTTGGMDRSELYYKDFLYKNEPNPYIDTHHAGNSTEVIAGELHIYDYLTTISTACSSSLNSIMFGARLIKNGIVDRVVAGGTDALTKFTLNGFNTLMILDKKQCRPFDKNRVGLNLGEGAAYLVLEKEANALKKEKKIYAELTGYANANDAFHQTASSNEGEGPFLAMKKALQTAKLPTSAIDYINVHGTGTENNDLTEGRAMIRLFGENIPEFSSTKAYTGHTLGAAGAVESVFSIMALQNNLIFPNLNFEKAIPETGLQPVTRVLKKELKHVLTNSFGFGGNDSSLVFSKPEVSNSHPTLKTGTPGPVKEVFINGIGAVAPQETLDPDHFLDEVIAVEDKFLQIKKPNFRDFINPKALRRMSKIVRMGMVSAKTALADAKINQPGAIVTGTGMGCQRDTDKFLSSLLDNHENLMNPTAFIQSTHNTISAQIALMLGNTNHNMAFVHRAFSFESALMDALMLINRDEADDILAGGIDEITEESWLIKTRINYFKKKPLNNLKLLNDNQPGGLAGESAAFFVLSKKKSENSYARLSGVDTLFKPAGNEKIKERIVSFLEQHGLKVSDIDLVLMGYNGEGAFDLIYDEIAGKLFENSAIAYYKHLCGEHDTASAFATWIAARILKTGTIPQIILKTGKNNKTAKRVLIYSQFRNINHSFILLEKA